MNIRFFQVILFCLTFNSYADSSENKSLLMKRLDGSKIDYYLFKESKSAQSKVLLLFLHGSDCNSVVKIDSIFKDYKNIWQKADLLLIEKYGIDKSLAYSSDAERRDCPLEYLNKDSPEQRVMDIKTVLGAVRKNTTYEKLIVIGGSEGAVIANLFTASVDYVDATIAFNGGGRWFIDDVLHNIRSLNYEDESKNKDIEGFREFSEHIINSDPFDVDVSGHGYKWWHQMLSIDQYSVLKKVKTPLLVVQGGNDLSVSPKKVDEMILALRRSRNKNIEYFTYANLDHGFKDSQGMSKRKEVIDDMSEWLKAVLYNVKTSVD